MLASDTLAELANEDWDGKKKILRRWRDAGEFQTMGVLIREDDSGDIIVQGGETILHFQDAAQEIYVVDLKGNPLIKICGIDDISLFMGDLLQEGTDK